MNSDNSGGLYPNYAANFMSYRQQNGATFNNINSGVAVNTSKHILGVGFTAGGTAALVLDGTSVNSALTTTCDTSLTRCGMGGYSLGSVARSDFAEQIITSDEPVAAVKTAVVTILKTLYGTV
jgi:hypothetical protein